MANLAEAGCTAIGANGLLARVGAYYHDIGKLKRPMYFKENQMGDNPHDRTDPRVSAAILTAHTRDGAQMAQKARIPQPVIDIIRQHHGDTPTIYFYDKAKKLYGDSIDISAFRYEGPCPQTREAAVVMLADGIEAATRAMSNPDPEKIDALIRNFVRARLNDGQLDSSDLTFSDLDKICGAFSTVLTGAFHERIEYPTVVIPPRGEAAAEKPAESSAGSASAQSAAQAAAQTAVQNGPANAAQLNENANAAAQPGAKQVGAANNGSQPAAGSASGQTVGTANNAASFATGQSVNVPAQPAQGTAAPQSTAASAVRPTVQPSASAQPARMANPAGQPAQSSAAQQTMAANAAHPNGASSASAQPVRTANPAGQPIPAHPVPGMPVPPMGGSGPSVGAAQGAVGAQNAQAFARPTRQAAPEFVSAGQPVPPSEEEGGERV